MSVPDLPITPVPHERLAELEFPKRGATFDKIVALAYTFDGYAQFGMETCAAMANTALSRYYRENILPEDITTLRACLFFEGRRWTLYDQPPDTKASIYIFALIDKIKAYAKSVA